MILTDQAMLERFYARDRASDGRFLTGVLTTGIYCLPSCPARKPLPENVRFFPTREAAREAGLRPRRRRRPAARSRAPPGERPRLPDAGGGARGGAAAVQALPPGRLLPRLRSRPAPGGIPRRAGP